MWFFNACCRERQQSVFNRSKKLLLRDGQGWQGGCISEILGGGTTNPQFPLQSATGHLSQRTLALFDLTDILHSSSLLSPHTIKHNTNTHLISCTYSPTPPPQKLKYADISNKPPSVSKLDGVYVNGCFQTCINISKRCQSNIFANIEKKSTGEPEWTLITGNVQVKSLQGYNITSDIFSNFSHRQSRELLMVQIQVFMRAKFYSMQQRLKVGLEPWVWSSVAWMRHALYQDNFKKLKSEISL